MRTESVLVPWSDAPSEHTLALILRQLIVGIRDLKPVSRGEEVQMNNILAAMLVIEMIENGLIISNVMERRKFRSIQKPAAANTIHRKEVPELFVTKADADASSRRAERAVRSIHIAEDSPS